MLINQFFKKLLNKNFLNYLKCIMTLGPKISNVTRDLWFFPLTKAF